MNEIDYEKLVASQKIANASVSVKFVLIYFLDLFFLAKKRVKSQQKRNNNQYETMNLTVSR